MKKSDLRKMIREELLKEDLTPLTPEQEVVAKKHFEPIVKAHGGKIIKYFYSMGSLACQVKSFRISIDNLVIGYTLSNSEADKLVKTYNSTNIDTLSNPKNVSTRVSPDTSFMYLKNWKT